MDQNMFNEPHLRDLSFHTLHTPMVDCVGPWENYNLEDVKPETIDTHSHQRRTQLENMIIAALENERTVTERLPLSAPGPAVTVEPSYPGSYDMAERRGGYVAPPNDTGMPYCQNMKPAPNYSNSPHYPPPGQLGPSCPPVPPVPPGPPMYSHHYPPPPPGMDILPDRDNYNPSQMHSHGMPPPQHPSMQSHGMLPPHPSMQGHHGSPHGNPHGNPHGSPPHGPHGSPHGNLHGNPHGNPHTNPHGSPHGIPHGSPHGPPQYYAPPPNSYNQPYPPMHAPSHHPHEMVMHGGMSPNMNNSNMHNSMYMPDSRMSHERENVWPMRNEDNHLIRRREEGIPRADDDRGDVESSSSMSPSGDRKKLSRKEFRETIGVQLYNDLVSGEYSYDEVIEKYKKLYPEYESKFTRNFCSKTRCGRIMTAATTEPKRNVKAGDPKIQRISKKSPRKPWTRMTRELFDQIALWEKDQGNAKRSDIEEVFNVNRSTYHRWKKKLGIQ